jgi:signal transduction histidine kinase
MMWKGITLRGRIYTILTALVFITLMGGLVMIWYTYRMEGLLTSIVDKNLAAYQAAEGLEAALVNQKGFVSYYFLDRNPDWLKQLGEYRQIFKDRLDDVRSVVENESQKNTIIGIEKEYSLYIADKDRVIAHYRVGDREIGAELHKKVRNRFFKILELCEKLKTIHTERIAQVRQSCHSQAIKLRIIAGAAVVAGFFLAVFFAFVLVYHILRPVRRLTIEAGRERGGIASKNEISTLRRSVEGLLEDVDQTQSELERSREHLLQAEKMAMVGRLAAGMAHSIRNPFTSVKMRLFSLNRNLDLTETQKDDFDVITEEIRHIDLIVQNFLEFSRPPKLKMQTISPSTVVDNALQLLEHRLKSYDVDIIVNRNRIMPVVEADPEQLKEVLVNIIVNACEAMTEGGTVTIEEDVIIERNGQTVIIRICDTGPGIPESNRDRAFQPFFTTKDEGTGLGLSIASRIVEEHQGRLNVTSHEGKGASFVIALPIKESKP